MAEDVKAAGGTLVAISPQKEEHNRRLERRLKLPFPILWDEDNRVAEEYGLKFAFVDELVEVYRGFGVDLPEHNGASGWTLPMPARYVIDADGVVRWSAVHADYTHRPEAEDSLAALLAL